MELKDAPMRVMYYHTPTDRVLSVGKARFEEDWWHDWLDSLLFDTDAIFFLVAETTDVFEEEWDFKEVAYGGIEWPKPIEVKYEPVSFIEEVLEDRNSVSLFADDVKFSELRAESVSYSTLTANEVREYLLVPKKKPLLKDYEFFGLLFIIGVLLGAFVAGALAELVF